MVKKKIKVCLFTAHSPDIGGGAANFRSLIEQLPELSIQWLYITPKPVPGYEDGYLGPAIMGSRIDHDIVQTWRMITRQNVSVINQVVEKLIKTDCDIFWIVSHNEGIRVALELCKAQIDRPIHLTINDDWTGAICARSIRYRLFGDAAKKMTIDVLKKVTSFDVTSRGMQEYYEQLSGRRGLLTHRFIPRKSVGVFGSNHSNDSNILRIGHIGSIYSKPDFYSFARLAKKYAEKK